MNGLEKIAEYVLKGTMFLFIGLVSWFLVLAVGACICYAFKWLYELLEWKYVFVTTGASIFFILIGRWVFVTIKEFYERTRKRD